MLERQALNYFWETGRWDAYRYSTSVKDCSYVKAECLYVAMVTDMTSQVLSKYSPAIELQGDI